MKLRLAHRLAGATVGVALLIVGVTVLPASAATFEEKLAFMSSWSQTSRDSYYAWNHARVYRDQWAAYGFDWSTDYCSMSPDQPLGFDFRLSCHRHDFGYRNYKAVSLFPENKGRIDDAFYADLRAKCATYNVFIRSSCYNLAWTYYQAVRNFGALSVTTAELERARVLKEQGEAQAAAYAAKQTS